jgi:hypothetical protein
VGAAALPVEPSQAPGPCPSNDRWTVTPGMSGFVDFERQAGQHDSGRVNGLTGVRWYRVVSRPSPVSPPDPATHPRKLILKILRKLIIKITPLPSVGWNLEYDNVERFSFGGAAHRSPRLGFRGWNPRR